MNKKLLVLVVSAIFVVSGCNEASHSQTSSAQDFVSTHAQQLSPLASVNKKNINQIAKSLNVSYKLVTNIPSDKCDQKMANGACFEVSLTFTSPQVINTNGWEIYFSHIAPIQSFESDTFTVEHLNGDLHKIALKDNFKGFKAGESKTLVFRAMFWSLSENDAMPNFMITADNLSAQVIVSTKPAIDRDSGLEYLPFVEPYTDQNKQFKRTADDATPWLTTARLYQRNLAVNAKNIDIASVIIPTPKIINLNKKGAKVNLSDGLRVVFNNVKSSDVNVALSRLTKLGLSINTSGLPLNLKIETDNNKMLGSYQLTVTSKAINIIGVDANGVFNGLQSLASLVSVGSTSIPLLSIVDEPHYEFRGMLIDVARNFHSKTFILQLLDQMAAYKLNKLHLHLGDDEGWRLEIPSLPELTDVGSRRCFDSQEENCLISQLGSGNDTNSSVNGFYSVSDYQEILKAASARHIQVIPSLDMPGHSRAAIKAMTVRYNKYMALENEEKANQFRLHDFDDKTVYSSVQFYNDNTINACLESSYAFVTEVMTQVKKMHADAGQPLTRYHIGADETAGAWLESPVCKSFVANNTHGVTELKQVGTYFIERVAKILTDLNIETAGWSDGLEHTKKENMPEIVQANAWDVLFWGGHDKVHTLANRDWQVVISTPDVLYFDFPYEADPKEYGYYWASRHTNTEKVFQFMPDNLPVHAEFWLDRQDNTYAADDTKTPLAKGKKFLGIQGQLWSENTRNDEMAEYKVFPRLLALAERAWYAPSWAVPYNYEGFKYNAQSNVFTKQQKIERDKQWDIFAQTLGKKEFAKLSLDHIEFRLPTVGAIIKDKKLFANVAFPGLMIEYQIDGGQWLKYQSPVEVNGIVNVRSKTVNGVRSSRVMAASVENK